MLVLLAKVRSIKVEPYWNVNKLRAHNTNDACTIKVEPYWNVNVSSNTFPILIAKIKVEPYWNVNSLAVYSANCSSLK